MIFKRTLALLSLVSLLLMMGGSFFGSSLAWAKEDYTNGPGTLTGEGDPGDGLDSYDAGGGSGAENYFDGNEESSVPELPRWGSQIPFVFFVNQNVIFVLKTPGGVDLDYFVVRGCRDGGK